MEYYNQVFDQFDKVDDKWTGQEFEKCVFKKLDLSQVAFTSSIFINCRFEDCNLTKIELENAKFNDVSFSKCKLTYADFGQCNSFGFHVDFDECQLDNTVFLNRKLRKARFVDCSLKKLISLNATWWEAYLSTAIWN